MFRSMTAKWPKKKQTGINVFVSGLNLDSAKNNEKFQES